MAAWHERYGAGEDVVAFFAFFAQTPPGFEDRMLAVLQAGLDAGDSADHARRCARLLQSYELLFWARRRGDRLMATSSLTAELWSSIDETSRAILAPRSSPGSPTARSIRMRFRFYAIQDAHYLREFARALRVAAARAPQETDIAMFNEHAAGAIAIERALHRELLWRPRPQRGRRGGHPRWAPTNLAYTSYCSPSPTAGRSPTASAPCCPATGSTGRSASSSFHKARWTRSPALDRHLRRRGVRDDRPGGARAQRPRR